MHSSNKNKSVVAACFMGLGALAVFGCAEQPEKSPGVIHEAPKDGAKAGAKEELKPFSQEVPAAAFKFDMVPIAGSGKVKPFYIGKTELTWEAFDPFVFRLDEADGGSAPQSGQGGGQGGGADAVSRPSKPYLPPDRGFGHEGYAAISMSYENAKAYCTWLSGKSGKKYRLPTVAEWQLACGGEAAKGDKPSGDKGGDKPGAWLAGNSGGVPHPVGTTMANANGLFDMRGNVMEWCTDEKGEGVACGGCYKDEAATCTTVHAADAEWNKSDPQIPKSKWWLADGPFVGFRVVCEP